MKNLFLITIMLAGGIRAQSISIYGRIRDGAGAPLEGVEVSLVSAGITGVTDGNGVFLLSGPSLPVSEKLHSRVAAISSLAYLDGQLIVHALSLSKAEIRLRDMKGDLVSEVFRGILEKGRTAFDCRLEGLGHTMFILSVKTPDGTMAYMLSAVANGVYRLNPVSFSGGRPLGKAAALPEWLQAVKAGYASHVQSIEAHVDTIDILMGPVREPDFGPNVYVFDPSMSQADIQRRVEAAWTLLGPHESQFYSDRVSFLFKAGSYNLDVDVGYYTQAAGLGMLPGDVEITGSVRSLSTRGGNVLSTFWRGAENMAVNPTDNGTNTWAVSQAAPFRRMHVRGNLNLHHNGGTASGGFMGDSRIDGQVNSGSQQQWFTRNSSIGNWRGGVWNMFFMGTHGAPEENWPDLPYTTVSETPKVREKPFLVYDGNAGYAVFVPSLRENTSGTSWENGIPEGDLLPIDLFYAAHPDSDNAASMNAALMQGKNLLLTPGIYHLESALEVTRPNTIVLGIGMALLIPDNGTAAINVSDVDGVRLAGICIDAGLNESPVLLRIGEEGSSRDHSENPVSLHDIFCRVGGASEGRAEASLVINSNDVIGDHFWLWRADHGTGVGWERNTTKYGLVVNGDNVTIYGLFCEHYHEYQTWWRGEGGRLYFYQCEIPYDVPADGSWKDGPKSGFASYKVADEVAMHQAMGLGIYSNFREGPVILDNAIETPEGPGILFYHMVTRFLNNFGEISNVINNTGGPATEPDRTRTVEQYP